MFEMVVFVLPIGLVLVLTDSQAVIHHLASHYSTLD